MKRKKPKSQMTGFELDEAAGGWRRFRGRMLQSYGQCFFPVLVCTILVVNITPIIMWAWIVAPALMTLGWYYNEFHPELH